MSDTRLQNRERSERVNQPQINTDETDQKQNGRSAANYADDLNQTDD
jgi:hypothetical protein